VQNIDVNIYMCVSRPETPCFQGFQSAIYPPPFSKSLNTLRIQRTACLPACKASNYTLISFGSIPVSRGMLLSSFNKKDSYSNKNNPAFRKNASSFWKDVPSFKRDVPGSNRETPDFNRNKSDSNRNESSFNRNESGSNRNKSDSIRNESDFNRNESDSNRNESGCVREDKNRPLSGNFSKYYKP
jgi:hypothetical protein